MNIFVASDTNYVPHLETLLVSIGENNKNVENIKFYILDGGISCEKKDNILTVSQKFSNIEIFFIEMTETHIAEMLGGTPSNDRSLSTFARIFIPNLINDNKALYFDVDAIVLQNLTELYDTDIDNFAIAGVLDTNPIKRHLSVGLENNEPYINAGMILWNLKKCREIGFVERCKEFIKEHNGSVDAMDQGTINGVLSKMGLIKILHPKFNVLTSFFQLNKNNILRIYKLSDYYSDDLLSEATDNPVFVHFTPNMTTRPWVKNCTHPLKEKYWFYRLQTSENEKTLQKDTRKIKLRIIGWIYRNLPISLYLTAIKLKKQK